MLLDAGLSPRRTEAMLCEAGLGGLPIHAMVLTHLDADHWNVGWLEARPETTRLYIHRRHRGRATREGILHRPSEMFEGAFSPLPGVVVSPVLCSHDELGVAAFRITLANGATLGYATDVGRPSDELVNHLAGVDVLALESNYCPVMQQRSGRPAFLVRRIMGGGGHLSNQQSADLAFRIAPRGHIVLLHLSRQCNTPDAARAAYDGCPIALTIARHDTPTGHIPVVAGPEPVAMPVVKQAAMSQALLWG
jgi:phosphoribosyl 1,2-cyclic phosphodiesterase